MFIWLKPKPKSKAVCLCLSQIQDEGQPLKQHQWQNRSVQDWSCQQVCLWLMGLNLEQYIPQFTAQSVDGEQLMQLNSDALKVSVHTHKHRHAYMHTHYSHRKIARPPHTTSSYINEHKSCKI